MRHAMRFVAGALGGMAAARWLLPRESLRGATALVTGGSRGLGLLLSRELAGRGVRLVLCGRDEEALGRARGELERRGAEVLTVSCDISIAEDAERFVAAAVERFGVVDVVVNNASIIQVAPLESLSLDDFHQAMGANFWGSVHVTLAALPHLRRSRLKRIVNVTSIGAEIAVPHLLPYACAKFAARGFSEGLAAELRNEGIRVTTVLPGLMRTGSFVNALFKGRRSLEMQWFALGSSLPLVSMDAARAARRIVRACEGGEAFLVLGLPAKALRIVHAVVPGLTTRVLAAVDRFLPAPGGAGPRDAAEPGREHRTGAARSMATALGDRAARENNELGGAQAEPA